jgi:hypothetical protein
MVDQCVGSYAVIIGDSCQLAVRYSQLVQLDELGYGPFVVFWRVGRRYHSNTAALVDCIRATGKEAP